MFLQLSLFALTLPGVLCSVFVGVHYLDRFHSEML